MWHLFHSIGKDTELHRKPVFINDVNSGITGVPKNIIILQFSM